MKLGCQKVKTVLGQVSTRSRSALTVGQKDAYSAKAAIDWYQLGFSASLLAVVWYWACADCKRFISVFVNSLSLYRQSRCDCWTPIYYDQGAVLFLNCRLSSADAQFFAVSKLMYVIKIKWHIITALNVVPVWWNTITFRNISRSHCCICPLWPGLRTFSW